MELTFPVLHWRICKLKGERKLRRETGEKRKEANRKERREWVAEEKQKGTTKGGGTELDRERCSDLQKRKRGVRDRALDCCSFREFGTVQFAEDVGAL